MKNLISQTKRPTHNFPLYWSVLYLLTIEGGSGHGRKSEGGVYNFVGTYLNGKQEKYRIIFEDSKMCLGSFCRKAGIKFWHADSMEELVHKMKDLTIDDITTLDDPEWIEFRDKEENRRKNNLKLEIDIYKDRIACAKSRKNAIRKDGNYRKDVQKIIDRNEFRIQKCERKLGTYEPELV